LTWSVIRNFGRVKYFNISYAVLLGVPILAESYKAIYSAVHLVNIDIQFPLTLKLIYLSSLCYAIAIAIYQYFCPETVKQYENEQIYVSAQQEILERAHPDRKCEIVLTNLLESQQGARVKIIDLQTQLAKVLTPDRDTIISELNKLVDSLYPSCIQRFLIKQYRKELLTRPWARYISGILYLAGTLLLSYSLIEKTYSVFSV
jgi:hypothetical protein